MRNATSLAALAVATAAFGAAPAVHAYNGLGCGLSAFREPSITGQNHVGSMTGGPYSGPGTVTIRCYLTLNGVGIVSTPTGSGSGAAWTSGQVQFSADITDVVEACTDVTTGSGSQTFCFVVTPTQWTTWTFWSFAQPLI